eukprot:gb/GFBE01017323.1/.p1 GENE.gb/GFBE01017323.1/~~gb/GFBE01017323.1/.p1  ORF type:complete len:689 (+),score=132.37 gb/GFBE01017323.1/:1-2067(+)
MDMTAASAQFEAEIEELLHTHRASLQRSVATFLGSVDQGATASREIAWAASDDKFKPDSGQNGHAVAPPPPHPAPYFCVEAVHPFPEPSHSAQSEQREELDLDGPNTMRQIRASYIDKRTNKPGPARKKPARNNNAAAHKEVPEGVPEEGATAKPCPQGHALEQFFTPAEGWRCNICDSHQKELASMQGCRECNYDICQDCFENVKVKEKSHKAKLDKVASFPGIVPSAEEQVEQTVTNVETKGRKTDDLNRNGTRKAVNMRKSAFITATKQEVLMEHKSLLQRITMSKYYEMCSGFVILCNCIYIGYQTNTRAWEEEIAATQGVQPKVTESAENLILQALFATIFTVELSMRWASDGMYFLNVGSKDICWNLLDILVVSLDVVNFMLELIVTVLSSDAVGSLGDFTILRVLRIIRVVRVAKVIRVMKFFKELRMMMYSIFSCIRSLLWVAAVLLIFLGMFSILFTSAVSAHLETPEKRRLPQNEDVQKSFGTLERSCISMYMAMSGGVDWGELYDALEPLPSYYRALFLLFITFAIFALVNIVTGLFVENAKQSSRQDREDMIQEELIEKAKYLRSMQALFEEMDFDGTGTINLVEFQKTLDDERITAYFNALKLDVSEACQLFQLLDWDNSGEISYIEFVEGCWKMQGEARSLDMKIMQFEIAALSNKIEDVRDWAMQGWTEKDAA